jgi:dCTP deaminase
MILTGSEITNAVHSGRIVIDPFDPDCVNPNSYNFKLSNVLKVYDDAVLDVRRPSNARAIHIPATGYVLEPRRLYLAATIERIGSEHYAPTYAARSSVARLGMFINLSAPLGDIGFVGCWTLQLYAINPVRVYPGMRIGQMMFWQPKGEIQLYEGKYQHATGPRSSEIYRDVAPALKKKKAVVG